MSSRGAVWAAEQVLPSAFIAGSLLTIPPPLPAAAQPAWATGAGGGGGALGQAAGVMLVRGKVTRENFE